MDLSNHEVLEETIKSIFNEQLLLRRRGFSPVPVGMLDPLIAPAYQWAGDLRDVDEAKLREAIQRIVDKLNDPARPRQTIDRSSIEQAIEDSGCHYLWFC